jgi:c-di-AMP phosphodiesterase-like protein
VNLDLQTIKTTAMWVLIAVAVIGIILAIIVKKIVGKIITLVLAALIVLFIWQQRARVVDYAKNAHSSTCASHPKFFGIDVTYPSCK